MSSNASAQVEGRPAHALLAAARRPRSAFLTEQTASQLAWIREATWQQGDVDDRAAGDIPRPGTPDPENSSAPAAPAVFDGDARLPKRRCLVAEAAGDGVDDGSREDMLWSLAPAGPDDGPSQVGVFAHAET